MGPCDGPHGVVSLKIDKAAKALFRTETESAAPAVISVVVGLLCYSPGSERERVSFNCLANWEIRFQGHGRALTVQEPAFFECF